MSKATLIHEWSKSDSGQAGIVMEAHDKNLGGGFAHTVRVFTKDNHTVPVNFKVNRGTWLDYGYESIRCEGNLSFSDSDTAELDRYITGLISVDADFFIDADYEFTTASLSLQSGKIKASKKITGSALISYYAMARLINYFPYAPFPNVRLYGVILAVQKELKTWADYKPTNTFVDKGRDTIILVYRELVANSSANSPYEKPSNWDTGNDYTGIPSALESEKPELGSGAVFQEPMYSYFFENGTYYPDTPTFSWHYPSPGTEWSNAVIHIKRNYNETNYGTANVALFDNLVTELQTQYSARFATVIIE